MKRIADHHLHFNVFCIIVSESLSLVFTGHPFLNLLDLTVSPKSGSRKGVTLPQTFKYYCNKFSINQERCMFS